MPGPIDNAGNSAAGSQANSPELTSSNLLEQIQSGNVDASKLEKLIGDISDELKGISKGQSLNLRYSKNQGLEATRKQQKENTQYLKNMLEALKKQNELKVKDIENNNSLSEKERADALKDQAADYKAQIEEIQTLQQINESAAEQAKQSKLLTEISKRFASSFDKVVKDNEAYRVNINTRLQGISDPLTKQGNQFLTWSNQLKTIINNQDKYGKIQSEVANAFGVSALVKQETLLKNIDTLVSMGVARDIEQRATLAALSDTIANTYDKFSKDISRLIRIQQEDQSTVMLGMESILTEMLNTQFRDTSYLTDVGTSNITGTLTEALSNMGAAQGSQFNFTVQKYLASLYSMGASQSMIQNLASAINALYSGNVQNISGDMQNLFAISAARSGQSYADILTEGIDGSDVNGLLKAMVGYLAEIAGSNNNITRAALGGVFGTGVSDLIAARNLQRSGLEAVSGINMTQGSAVAAVRQGIEDSLGRIGSGAAITNLLDNLLYAGATNIVGSGGMGQVMWQLVKTIQDVGGDINLIDPSVLGNSLGIGNLTVGDIITAGTAGFGLLGSIGAGMSSLLSGNTPGSINDQWWNTTNLGGYTGRTVRGGGSTRGGGAGRTTGGGGRDISGMETSDYLTEQTGSSEMSSEKPATSEQMDDWTTYFKSLVQDNAVQVRVVNLDDITVGEGKNKSVRIVTDNEITSRLDTIISDMKDEDGILTHWRVMP